MIYRYDYHEHFYNAIDQNISQNCSGRINVSKESWIWRK